MLIPSLFVLLTICAFFTALTAAPLYADPLLLTDLNSRAPSSQVPLDAKAVGSIHASISLSEQITSTGESFDPPLDPSQTTVYETGSDRTKTSVVSSAANSRAEINATLDTQSVQSSAPSLRGQAALM
jgi:hypothetical protein